LGAGTQGSRRQFAGTAILDMVPAHLVKYQLFKYPGTQHGFNNDTTPRYDKAAAALAWQRTMEFFKKNLKS
jgi:dienelactone hydrolase